MTTLSNQKQILGHPIGLFILFFTEMWERFSYYGMRGLLVLYLAASSTADDSGMGWTTKDALWFYGWYTMFVYVVSIPGGIIADRWLGQKKTVMLGGGLLVLGHLILAIPSDIAFFTGVVFVILGVGGLKPNISTLVGKLYKQGDIRCDKGFTIFYIGINLGAFLAGIIVGVVAQNYGWHFGFGLAGIGMIFGQMVYIWGQKFLVGIGDKISQKSDDSKQSNKALTKVEKDRVVVLLISFLIVIVFWGAFEQAGGLMNLYTDVKVDRTTGFDSNISFLKEIPTVVFQSLNSTYIIIFGTLVAGFWAFMRKKNKETSSIFKMAIGTIIMGLGFIFMMFASKEASAENFGKASMIWVFLAYLFHTLGELCSSPVAMSFITKLSPAKYASIMMGIYFAATGLGNKLAGNIGESSQLKPYEGIMIASKNIMNDLTGKIKIDDTKVDYPINQDKNIEMKVAFYTEENQVIFQEYDTKKILPSLFELNSESNNRFLETLKASNVSRESPYHAALLFEKEKTQKNEKIEGDSKNYKVSFVIEEEQSAQEYNTFKFITIFTVAFGLLLILFLKKLKVLTHGAENDEKIMTI